MGGVAEMSEREAAAYFRNKEWNATFQELRRLRKDPAYQAVQKAADARVWASYRAGEAARAKAQREAAQKRDEEDWAFRSAEKILAGDPDAKTMKKRIRVEVAKLERAYEKARVKRLTALLGAELIRQKKAQEAEAEFQRNKRISDRWKSFTPTLRL